MSYATGLWVDKSLSLKPSFVDYDYKADVNKVDFQTKPDEARVEINSWAEESTKGLIEQVLVPGSVTTLTRLIFANALYFKGAWADVFDASRTKEHSFYLPSRKRIRVSFMTSNKNQYVNAFDGFKVLRLRYKPGQDERWFSMYIFLPDARFGLPALVERLHSEGSTFVDRCLPSERVRVGSFLIPKFKISFGLDNFDFSEVIKNLGLVLPSLTEIVDGKPLKLDLIHKSVIDVNEQGTEAAAATVPERDAWVEPNPKKIDFVADHPFMFLIREDLIGTVMFAGQLVNPLAG